MLKVSSTPNKEGLWSVRDEENQRVALFYDDGLAREMVEIFNAAQQSVQSTLLTDLRNHCVPVNGVHAPFCTGHESQSA